jgi:hypothetical protein
VDARESLAAHKEHAAAIESLLGRIPLSLALDRVVLAWVQGGLLTPGWADGRLSRSWMNVAAHNAVACALSGQNPAITEAALVHDAFKRRE